MHRSSCRSSRSPGSVPEAFEDHAKLMMDLQVLAFQTDLTRVITYVPAREGSNRSYREIGVSDGHHSITHHQNDAEKIENVAKIDALLVKNFAYLLERLKATPDGEGNLLDHSIIVYGSGTGDGNRHTHHDLPVVLVGRRRGPDQGRAAHALPDGNAAQQPVAECARQGWRAGRELR